MEPEESKSQLNAVEKPLVQKKSVLSVSFQGIESVI